MDNPPNTDRYRTVVLPPEDWSFIVSALRGVRVAEKGGGPTDILFDLEEKILKQTGIEG